jgi:sulfur-carrier protein
MKILVKYFGAIAEKTGAAEEVLNLEETGFEVEEIRSFCIQKYGLEDDESIQTAVNQKLLKKGTLRSGDEIAFLPPYAGG